MLLPYGLLFEPFGLPCESVHRIAEHLEVRADDGDTINVYYAGVYTSGSTVDFSTDYQFGGVTLRVFNAGTASLNFIVIAGVMFYGFGLFAEYHAHGKWAKNATALLAGLGMLALAFALARRVLGLRQLIVTNPPESIPEGFSCGRVS